ncbi:unnamed protein product [Amaranthus hypochondriacus]
MTSSNLFNFLHQNLNIDIFSFLPPLILFLTFLYKYLLNSNKTQNLPSSPPKLPIIGNLHQLGKLPHRTLRSLANKYGEIMLLHFGNRPTLVISSAKSAEQIMKTHDLIFANRPKLRFIHRIFYDGKEIAFNSYCAKWRHMKSICVLQLLSNKKVKSFRHVREQEIDLMINKIKNKIGKVVNLSEMFLSLSNDLLCRAALGRKYTDKYGNGADFQNLFKDMIEVMGAVSVGDYIPFLGWIDILSGMEGRVDKVSKRFDDFMEEIVEERMSRMDQNQAFDGNQMDNDYIEENDKDFVHILVQLHREDPQALTRVDIKAIILDMFSAGTETTATTLEWIMIELLRHPSVMKNLQEEVRSISKNNKKVIEDDLENMIYLNAVINETFRLHPPLPLLIFRESSDNVKIDKYDINPKTQVIINAWAIQRDPNVWKDDAEDFKPERFLTNSSSVDVKGQHFELIPFGAGRRGCPGVSYGLTNIKFALASLIYEFNWALPEDREGNTFDVAESGGFTVRPQNPPMIIPSTTLFM